MFELITDGSVFRILLRKLLDCEDGKVVLVALNFLARMLVAMIVRGGVLFHIFIPHPFLKEEYRQRYISRGNNQRFILEVMFI